MPLKYDTTYTLFASGLVVTAIAWLTALACVHSPPDPSSVQASRRPGPLRERAGQRVAIEHGQPTAREGKRADVRAGPVGRDRDPPGRDHRAGVGAQAASPGIGHAARGAGLLLQVAGRRVAVEDRDRALRRAAGNHVHVAAVRAHRDGELWYATRSRPGRRPRTRSSVTQPAAPSRCVSTPVSGSRSKIATAPASEENTPDAATYACSPSGEIPTSDAASSSLPAAQPTICGKRRGRRSRRRPASARDRRSRPARRTPPASARSPQLRRPRLRGPPTLRASRHASIHHSARSVIVLVVHE